MSERTRWCVVVVFATAMAWMESATVVYLRLLVDRIDPYQSGPLPQQPAWVTTELIREVATLVMLFTVGWLAGRNWRSRLSYSLIAFGVWDILYYVFLAIIAAWPRSLFDWDVLFLLPLPWWGPVLAPALIAAIMIVGGTLVTQCGEAGCLWPRRWSRWLGVAGILLALLVFMQDAIHALPAGAEAVRSAMPTRFNWPGFVIAVALMSVSIADLFWQVRGRGVSPTGVSQGLSPTASP